jgi:hypothetical protein
MAAVRHLVVISLVLTPVATATGCEAVPERAHTQDDARLVAPLPACVSERAGPRTAGVATSLKEDEAWRAVFPSYDPSASQLPQGGRACNGDSLFADPLLAGGAPRGGWPLRVVEGDAVFAAGADRMRVAWLRAVNFDDGSSGGALALLRAYESTVEVFAIGAYRGIAEQTHFTVERLGAEIVVVAQADGCAKHAGACDSTVRVYLPRQGVLGMVAKFAVARVAYAEGGEPGVRGRVEYRLSASPQFVPGEIRLVEQVVARDESGRDVRRAELTRGYALLPDDTMVPSDDSIWWRVFPHAPTKRD